MSIPKRVYLDTNIFVYAFEQTGLRSDLLSEFLRVGFNSGFPFVTSELTLSELLVKPHRNGDAILVRQYEVIITTSPWLDVPAVHRPVLAYAAELRARYRSLKLPDAIHLATAFGAGCSHFLTGDTGISGPYDLFSSGDEITESTPRLEIIRPDEPTLTSLLESLENDRHPPFG